MEEKERLEIISLKLEIKKKKINLIEIKKDHLRSDKKMFIDQISSLRDLMTERVIDEDKTIFGSEPKYKPVFNDSEITKLKKKVWDLLEKF